jgi:cell division cycle 2-like
MASTGKSRWADSDGDAAFAAQQKKEREEKKRLKAEKARKEAERQAQLAAQQREQDDKRPSKRRRVTPEPGSVAQGVDSEGTKPLLQFSGRGFGRCRSVELFDKLNDIEEGTYGWVSRAKETATGSVVALKRLKIDSQDRNGLPVTGLREIQILKRCQHRNIVRLREVVVGDNTSKIEKYASHGCLAGFESPSMC